MALQRGYRREIPLNRDRALLVSHFLLTFSTSHLALLTSLRRASCSRWGMTRGGPTHVLLVDDDRDTREMYSEYLSYSGLQVTEASSGKRALESAARHCPDVVVTDIAMPEMDGLELSRRLRAGRDTHSVPIITVSGQMTEPGRQAGVNAVLAKPCDPDRLLHAIEDVLRAGESDK